MERQKFKDFLAKSEGEKNDTFDEANYYLGEQSEMGGVSVDGLSDPDAAKKSKKTYHYHTTVNYHGSADDDQLDIGTI